MWIQLNGLNIVNAIFTTVLVLVTAFVGLYHFRRATRASMIEVVDDLGRINAIREEANETLQARIAFLDNELSDLKSQMAHMAGMNQYLLESKIAWRRHSEVMEIIVRKLGQVPPPRPPET